MIRTSGKLTAAALISTTTSPAPAVGSGKVLSRRLLGVPKFSHTIACMASPDDIRGCVRLDVYADLHDYFCCVFCRAFCICFVQSQCHSLVQRLTRSHAQ